MAHGVDLRLSPLGRFGFRTTKPALADGAGSGPDGRGNHGFNLGIEGSDEVGSFLLLESDLGSKLVSIVVFKDTSSGVIDEYETSLPAQVGESQSPNHVGPDRLHFVRFAPVNVRPTRHAGGVEDVRRCRRLYVVLQL